MKWIVGSIFCFVFATAFSQVNQLDAQGRKQGKWEKTHPGTRVYAYRGQFKNDKPVGKFSYFYTSGKVKAIIEHDEHSSRSVGYYYHDGGGVMSYGIYRNMKKDSVWTNLNKKGELTVKETFYRDSLHGPRVVFYARKEGVRKQMPSIVSHYKDGKLDGEYIEYFPNAAVKQKGNYANNKKVGIWNTYHASGKKMMQIRYKDGIRHGWSTAYDKTGKEIAKKYFYHGRLLEGKQLQRKMEQMKKLGINPNE